MYMSDTKLLAFIMEFRVLPTDPKQGLNTLSLPNLKFKIKRQRTSFLETISQFLGYLAVSGSLYTVPSQFHWVSHTSRFYLWCILFSLHFCYRGSTLVIPMTLTNSSYYSAHAQMHFSIFSFLLSRDDEYFPLHLQFSTSHTKLIAILSYADAKALSIALRSC